jgi:FkbM family methyltransferase
MVLARSIVTPLFVLLTLTLTTVTPQFCTTTTTRTPSTTTAATTTTTTTTTYTAITPNLLTCPDSDIATTTTFPAFKICLRPAVENDFISNIIKGSGIWEPINTARIVNLFTLQKSSTTSDPKKKFVVDIGAHLGWYTLLAASHGFSVVAFEPLRAQRERLQASVLLNGFEHLVTIMPYAVSNKVGFSTMWTGVLDTPQGSNYNTGGSWIRPKGWTTHEASVYAQVSEIGIQTVLLDHALNLLNIADDIFLLKADIEGHLGLALSEGEQTTKLAKFLFLEITPKIEALNGCDTDRMLSHLFQQGFRMCYPPHCMGKVCGANDIILGEPETCLLDDLPYVGKKGTEDNHSSEWMYEDVLFAQLAPSGKR